MSITQRPTRRCHGLLRRGAAAHAALQAVNKGAGVYNIAEDDGAVSSAKAKRELGFDPAFRIP